jgi:NDP-sugar pyrophosphorylase family protein
MLTLYIRNGLACPKAQCDHCGAATTSDDAIVAWRQEGEPREGWIWGTLHIFHAECFDLYSTTPRWMSMPLTDYLVDLAHNLPPNP